MSSTFPTSPGSPERVPTTLGRYRVLSILGRGGMSTAYLAAALGPAGFRKVVVLKVLREDLAEDPGFAGMFLDEARLSAQLSHPNVVSTFEVGRDAGLSFIAMEYLEGQPLARVLKRLRDGGMRLPTSLSVHVATRVLDALAYAHSVTDLDGRPLGVVHRDVSPENVFLTYDGRVQLMDFGVAQATTSLTETRAGAFKGKIAYMPPEQARGLAVDRRADLFATGALLWEMLTGRRLWHGRTDPVIAAELLAGRIPNALAECPDLPAELAPVLRRALAPRPEDRYSDANAFRADLERRAHEVTGAPAARLAATVSTLFEQEKADMTRLVQERLRRLDRGDAIPPVALSGVVFGTPTPDSDMAHTTVSNAIDSVPAPAGGPRWMRRLAVGLGTTALLFALLLLARRSPGLALPLSSLIAPVHGAGGAASADTVPPPPPVAAAAPGGCGEGPIVELTGDIEDDATLGCESRYLLRHVTTVRPGATLTIEPGTVILGDPETRGTLVVEARGRILAVGTPESPIVFTSARPEAERRAGDWGGVIVLGNAPTNLVDAAGQPRKGAVEGLMQGGRYGGSNPDDDSGRIRFVRIEYAGTEIAPNNEINGLTLAGVGRGTIVDHVQVRETLDDCFEFFGGTVDARYLVCDSPGDDGFDWDQGYVGRLQFLLMRDDAMSDASNGFEGDNAAEDGLAEPRSAPTIYNATLCGNGGDGPRPSYGILLRHGSRGAIHDAIVSSFHVGFDRRDLTTGGEIRSTLFVHHSRFDLGTAERDVGDDTDDDGGYDETRWLRVPHRKNGTEAPVGFDCRAPDGLGYKPEMASTEGATAPPADGFFDARAAYRGAFRDRDDRWDQGAWVVPPR